MEPEAPFCRAAGAVVLDPETVKDLDGAVVHVHGQLHVHLTHWPSQQFLRRWIQVHYLGGPV